MGKFPTHLSAIASIKKKKNCNKPRQNNFRWSKGFVMAKISSDVSVNECQSNNIKDITGLMIDKIRKKQGLLSDKWLLFGVPLP